MEDSNRTSINVFTNHKKDILESTNSSNEYILKLNEELNNQYVSVKLECENLKNEMFVLEEDNDKQDKSMRYMRGMIKNYIELNDLHKTISNQRNKMLDFTNRQFEKLEHIFYFTILLYLINNIFFMYTGYVTFKILIHNIFSILICTYFSTNYYNYTHINQNNNYKECSQLIDISKNKINEIENGNDFLTEYIDGL